MPEIARHLKANQMLDVPTALYLQAIKGLHAQYLSFRVTPGYRMTAAAASALSDLSRVDRRSRSWRQRVARRAEIVASLGGESRLSLHQRELLELALGIGALVTHFQAQLASGEQVDSERYIAATKEHRRILTELKLPRTGAPAPTLADHLAKRAAERADASAG